MKKRILSLLLSLALCFSLLPTAAMAEDGSSVASVVVGGVETCYDSLQAAVNAMADTSNQSNMDTLKLLKDVTLTDTLTISSGTFQIDLNGKTLSSSAGTAAITVGGSASITIVNINAYGNVGNVIAVTTCLKTTGSGRITVAGGTYKLTSRGTLFDDASGGSITLNGGYYDITNGGTTAEIEKHMAAGYHVVKDSTNANLYSVYETKTMTGVTVTLEQDKFSIAPEYTSSTSGETGTLQGAIDYIQTEASNYPSGYNTFYITLYQDVTESITIPANITDTNGNPVTIVLCLNGYTLTNTAGQDTITNNGKLIISTEKDSKNDSYGTGSGEVVNVSGMRQIVTNDGATTEYKNTSKDAVLGHK